MTGLLPFILAAPLLGFIVNGALALVAASRPTTRRPSSWPGYIATAASAASFVFAVLAVRQARHEPGQALGQDLWTWIPVLGDFSLRLDGLSSAMVLVVAFIGTLIHVYSVGYMRGDHGYARFMAYLNLFLFCMLLLVLASNYLLLFAGWEGVGLSSYLLIGFWHGKKTAVDAGKKAFLVNRCGDAALLLGILLAFATFGTLEIQTVLAAVQARPIEMEAGVLTAMALLFAAGACGKSAQWPLHVWLPDAMEGPTPVSALIHAATMVTAGVYFVVRSSALFSHAPAALVAIALIGAVTALMAATIALVQDDIKRVLAYSTISQIGYMFFACGVGAYDAAMFHLVTHAFFKALLFLGAGSVIHALAGEQDLRRMGGLRRPLPWTHGTMLVGCLAIAGLPPLSGFFSKDAILLGAFEAGGPGPLVGAIGLLTAALTAFYTFRLYFMVFTGPARGATDVHEAPLSMRVPLVVLAAGAAGMGVAGLGSFRGAGTAHAPSHAAEVALMTAGVVAAMIGLAVALRLHGPQASASSERIRAPSGFRHVLSAGYFFDETYHRMFVRGFALGGGRVLHDMDRFVIDGGDGNVKRGSGVNGLAWLCRDILARASSLWDRVVVDGAVNLTAHTARHASYFARAAQTGLVQQYVWLMVVGVLVLAVAGRLAMGVY